HSDRIQRQGEGPRAKSRRFALAALTVNESDCHINCFLAGRTSSLTEAGLLQKSLNLLSKSVYTFAPVARLESLAPSCKRRWRGDAGHRRDQPYPAKYEYRASHRDAPLSGHGAPDWMID